MRLKKIVLEDLQRVLGMAKAHEKEFVAMLQEKSKRKSTKDSADKHREYEETEKRIAMLDRIIQNLYEDKVCGSLTEERFKKLSQTYEQEQAELTEKIDALRADIAAVKKDEEDISRFMRLVKKYTELTELTPEVVRTFIDKILIHKRQSDKQRSQEVEIIYNCVGGIPEIES